MSRDKESDYRMAELLVVMVLWFIVLDALFEHFIPAEHSRFMIAVQEMQQGWKK